MKSTKNSFTPSRCKTALLAVTALAIAGCSAPMQRPRHPQISGPAKVNLEAPPNVVAMSKQAPATAAAPAPARAAVPAPAAATSTPAKPRSQVVSATTRHGWQPAGTYITDKQIQDTKTQIAKLNEGGRFDGNYEWAKARCMINLAAHTYTERATDGTTEYLYGTAKLLADQAVAGGKISLSTPQIPGYQRANHARWNELDALVQSRPEGARCAEPALACAAVSLLGADYETGQGYGAHENHGAAFLKNYSTLFDVAKQQVQTCKVPPPPAPPVAVAPVESKPKEEAKPIKYVAASKALFAFDQAHLDAVRPDGMAVITNIVGDVKRRFKTISKIEVGGHADRLGSESHNMELSANRAANVGNYLKTALSQQFPNIQVTTQSYGATQQVKVCVGNRPTQQLIECLEPNRRVEIIVTGEVDAAPAVARIPGVVVQ